MGPVAARIHQEIEDLLPNALVSALRSLKMGIDLPPIGDHTVAVPADAELMAHVRSVAIVSAIGQSFDLVNPGVGFFVKRAETTMPVADAGIDDAVEAIARSVLSKHYAVKSIPADRAAIARTTIIPGLQLPTFLGLTRTNDVDAYILIVKAMRSEAPYGGLGVLHVTPLVNHTTSVFADYGIVVVDAHTLRSVVGTTGAEPVIPPCPKTDLSHSGQASPLLECAVDESFWPSSGDTLTSDELAKVRDTAMKILSGSIPETLFHLGLDQPDEAAATADTPTQDGK